MRLRVVLASLLLAVLAACAPRTGVDGAGVLHLRPETRDGVHVVRVPAAGVGRTISVRRTLFSSIVVPRGYAPAPGTCRVWHHDRAPARQPPPGDCPELERLAPRGSYLIYG